MKNSSPNALINETSPYLLQHAYNPVQWYPWGTEALQLSKQKDLPILVSIGYSACHWCHVMERESFENAETAAFMNEHFINIKIDREERPDLDHIYMDAVQAISGSGGWPLNVFLTTEAKPFYGGTYFPPQKAFNRPSWLDVLYSMSEYWKNKREDVEEQAKGLMDHLTKSNKLSFKLNIAAQDAMDFLSMDKCKIIADNILTNADKKEGGFGVAPKFLQTASIQYLLQYAHLSGKSNYKEQALLSLIKMFRGGIYDQLGGGISRYSTDNEWLLPHFEKMLYDNALLVIALCDAYQLTKQKEYKDAIVATLQFVTTELYDNEGGYYTALDADSEGVEGKFYVWSKGEIENILGKDAAVFCEYYNVTEEGNWEHTNILHVKESIDDFAATHNLEVSGVKEMLKISGVKLLAERNKRVRPGLDDKILLNCNALLLTAFCKAYAALQTISYKERATDLAAFIEQKFRNKEQDLYHTYKQGNARYLAFLDDYAYYIEALIQLQEITGNQEYLFKAKGYTDYLITHFSDEEENLFYYTGAFQQDIIIRKTEVYDGATPSANALMAHNLLYLSIVFEEHSWHSRALGMLKTMYNAIEKYPGSFAKWAGIYLQQTAGIKEIAISGGNYEQLLMQVLEEFIPNKILQASNNTLFNDMPVLKSRMSQKEAVIYVCSNYTCLQPVFSIEALEEILKKESN